MSDNPKVSTAHRHKAAIVYVRQSTLAQLERNRESTTRQYDLVAKAVAVGWPRGAVRTRGSAGPRPRDAEGSLNWQPSSAVGRSVSCWRWRCPGSPATMPT